jgi:hypothetical protein
MVLCLWRTLLDIYVGRGLYNTPVKRLSDKDAKLFAGLFERSDFRRYFVECETQL